MGGAEGDLVHIRKSVPSYGSSGLPEVEIDSIPARIRRRLCMARAAAWGVRPHMEAMETRVLMAVNPGPTLNTLGYFGGNLDGAQSQSALVADSDGNFYGTTSAGGTYGAGTVFEIAKNSNKITTMVSFNGIHGASPFAGVTLDAKGNIFGTTYEGGINDEGTVFEIAKSKTPEVTTLASFGLPNGEHPTGGVTLDASGNLYGTTDDGGANGDGTVYEVPLGSNAITTLAPFNNTPDKDGNWTGSRPNGSLLLDQSGNLFGTTYLGGRDKDNVLLNDGTVFKIALGSNKITTLASFNGDNGAGPYSSLTMDGSGNLFGTTKSGGANKDGTVFEIPGGSTTISTVVSFSGTDGSNPYAAVTLDQSGNLFGTTLTGGEKGKGTLFEIASGTNTTTTLFSFHGPDGSTPYGPVMLDSSGNLFGTTELGGDNGTGTVFTFNAAAQTLSTIASFDGTGAALYPYSDGVSLDPDGNLFGMNPTGGTFGQGMVYEIAAGTANFTILASFDGTNGSLPEGVLAIDAKGNLFGTTNTGGANDDGTVFEIASGSKAITTLVSFSGTDGSNPIAGLTIDPSGNLFGTTNTGGANGFGTVFELAKGATTIATVASFDITKDGGNPTSGVTLDASGNLFGTVNGIDNSASPGGTDNTGGIIYEIANGSNSITTRASFSVDNGQYLNGQGPDSVILDAQDNLYGTAYSGGSQGFGTVFELPADSHTVTALASFTVDSNGLDDGENPHGSLVLDSSGNLFGATYFGGANADGTIFEIAKVTGTGTLTTLTSFDGTHGQNPWAGLAMDAAGNLYGTTENGGVVGDGTVFERSMQTIVTLAPYDAPNPAQASQELRYRVNVATPVPDGETVTIEDTSNGNVVVATGTLNSDSAVLLVPANTLADGTHNLVAVYAGDDNFPPGQSIPYAQVIGGVFTHPALVGTPMINGDNPNGLFTAAGQGTNGKQRSMVEDIVYTFNEAVTIPDANAAFTVLVAGPAGGTVPTTLFAQAVAGSNGTQWAVSLTGKAEGILASIANGEYSIQINPAGVFAASDGTTAMAAGTGRTDTFFRLFGDINGDESISTFDYGRFKQALNGAYNPAFDYDGSGTIGTLDYGRFKQDMPISYFGDGFVTTI
jgi:uncharacterized repeat protein (TIGR03803 family)